MVEQVGPAALQLQRLAAAIKQDNILNQNLAFIDLREPGRMTVRAKPGGLHLLLFYAALVVELFNSLVHTIDGYTAVVWTGMALSVVGAILALAAAVTLLALPVAWVGHRGARA